MGCVGELRDNAVGGGFLELWMSLGSAVNCPYCDIAVPATLLLLYLRYFDPVSLFRCVSSR